MDLNFSGLNDLIIGYGGKMILSIVVLILGLSIIKRIVKLVSNRFEKVGFDKSLRSFLLSLIKVSLQIILVITIASMLGVEMTSFIAIIGSAGLAVGLALQGSLSNFAGGVLILILKPFKAGDYIEASGHAGTVEEIQVFYTILNTPDNKRIIIPNANLSNSSTINYTANPKRRIDFTFSAGYDNDIKKVKAILNEIAKNHPLILDTPKPQVLLGEHGASSVNYYLRAWCETENYWNIYFELLEKVKLEFDKEGINIPYPQMDVHLNN